MKTAARCREEDEAMAHLVGLAKDDGGYSAMGGRAKIRRAVDSSAGRGRETPRGWLLTLDGQQAQYATLSDVRERLDAEAAYETSCGRAD